MAQVATVQVKFKEGNLANGSVYRVNASEYAENPSKYTLVSGGAVASEAVAAKGKGGKGRK